MDHDASHQDYGYSLDGDKLVLHIPPPPGLRDGIAARIMAGRDLAIDGRIALAFDCSDGTRHKHGRAEAVEAWAEDYRQRLRAVGFDQMAEDLKILYFEPTPQAVDTLNYLLGNDTRILTLWNRLQEQALADAPGAEDDAPYHGPSGMR